MPMPGRLFGKGKRNEIRDAISQGRLADKLKPKPPRADVLEEARTLTFNREEAEEEQTVPAAAPSPAPAPQRPRIPVPAIAPIAPPDARRVVPTEIIGTDPQNGFRLKDADKRMIDAIRGGNAAGVEDAIRQGANVNGQFIRYGRHRQNDCMIPDGITPLKYAERLGMAAIVQVLKKHGARE